MKRDFELIRKLILNIENDSQGKNEINGYSKEQIGYHTYLLVDAGLAKGIDLTAIHDVLPQWQALHLTSAGHDFADAARNESIWQKAREIVKDKTGGVTIDVMKQVLVSIIKNALDL